MCARSVRAWGPSSIFVNPIKLTSRMSGARRNSPSITPAKQRAAINGDSVPGSPAAATISGDGVSPAAIAAASRFPPGNPAATAIADGGRRAGSRSRHRKMTRSMAGSRSGMCVDRLAGSAPFCARPPRKAPSTASARLPVNISYNTRPSAYTSVRVVTSRPSCCSGAM